MPILARIQRTALRTEVIPVDDRRLEFESLDGRDIIDWSGDPFISVAGLTGVDLPPQETIREQIPGLPGGRLREVRDLERTVFLPMHVRPADRDWRALLANLGRVAGHLNWRDRDYVAAEGTFDLVAYSGVTGRRSLRCTYLEGMEGDYGADVAFGTWQILGIRLLAVDPYWRGQQWSTPTVGIPDVRPFLSDNPADHPWGLSPSVALGEEMPVTVGGGVPSPAVVELTGPATTTHITSPQGLDVTLGALSAGQTLTLDTGRTKRCQVDGSDAWNLLGDSPQWRPLPPGEAAITIAVTGATSATRARVYGTELWQTAWWPL